MSDTIGNMLTTIRNGYLARKKTVLVPYSAMKFSLGKLLVTEGYLSGATEVSEEGKKSIRLVLRYIDKLPVLTQIERVSKPGRRVYAGYTDLRAIMGGQGVSVISTPQGLLSNKKARTLQVGGEIICRVW